VRVTDAGVSDGVPFGDGNWCGFCCSAQLCRRALRRETGASGGVEAARKCLYGFASF
jgi:hypothetical protein